MNRQDLVATVAGRADITKKNAEKAVAAFVDTIKSALHAGDKVSLQGFGSFEVRERKARSGRNPQNGTPITIPSGKIPAFKPGKELRDAL